MQSAHEGLCCCITAADSVTAKGDRLAQYQVFDRVIAALDDYRRSTGRPKICVVTALEMVDQLQTVAGELENMQLPRSLDSSSTNEVVDCGDASDVPQVRRA